MSNTIPPGHYRAVAVPVSIDGKEMWAQFGHSKAGNPQVAVSFALLDEGPYKGRRLSWFGSFTDAAGDRTVESLRLLGFKTDELLDLPKGPLDQEVSVTVEHGEWEGKRTVKIAWINAAGGGLRLTAPMKPDELRKFSAKYKSKVKSKPIVEGPRAAAPAPVAVGPSEDPVPVEDKGDDPWATGNEPPPAHTDNDIPF
jgi:hypothetical protein